MIVCFVSIGDIDVHHCLKKNLKIPRGYS